MKELPHSKIQPVYPPDEIEADASAIKNIGPDPDGLRFRFTAYDPEGNLRGSVSEQPAVRIKPREFSVKAYYLLKKTGKDLRTNCCRIPALRSVTVTLAEVHITKILHCYQSKEERVLIRII